MMRAVRACVILAFLLAGPGLPAAAEPLDTAHEQQPLTAAQHRQLIKQHLRDGKASFAHHEDDQAIRLFSQVLRWEPGNREAQAYLERIAKRTSPSAATEAHEQELGRATAHPAPSIPPTAGTRVGHRLTAAETAAPGGSPNFARTAAATTTADASASRDAARARARERAIDRALQRQARRIVSGPSR